MSEHITALVPWWVFNRSEVSDVGPFKKDVHWFNGLLSVPGNYILFFRPAASRHVELRTHTLSTTQFLYFDYYPPPPPLPPPPLPPMRWTPALTDDGANLEMLFYVVRR